MEFIIEEPLSNHTALQLATFKIITLKQKIQELRESLELQNSSRSQAETLRLALAKQIDELKAQLLEWGSDYNDLKEDYLRLEAQFEESRRDTRSLSSSLLDEERRAQNYQSQLIK